MHQTHEQLATCCAHDMGEKKDESTNLFNKIQNKTKPYYKLLINVAAIIILSGFLAKLQNSYWHGFMQYSMGLYFISFGMNQAASIKESALMFQAYDPLAKKIPIYGYLLPFIQIAIGIVYLLWSIPYLVNTVAAIVLIVNTTGVISVIRNKRNVRCGCMGEQINVSVGKVTLIENSVMLFMVILMLVLLYSGVVEHQHSFLDSTPIRHTQGVH